MRFIKNYLLLLLVFFFLGSTETIAKETSVIDGGILEQGRVLVPMRSIFENLDATVVWDASNRSIVSTKEELKFELFIGSFSAKINNETNILEVAPKIINGKTVVPLRFISEALGAKVSWDQNTKKATIHTINKEMIVNVSEEEISITISAAGDVTLGGDPSSSYHGSFNQEAKNNGHAHFVKNIKNLFAADDLTIVNLETTLTKATSKAKKQFTFKGDPAYTEILKLGSIEAVNLANNHTFDFKQKGYDDTISHLKKADIGYFGFENKYVTEIKKVKVGLLGYKGWNDNSLIRNQIKKDIQSLHDQNVKIVIVSFHWGEEKSYVPNQTQKNLGRYTVDVGADLVVGHHPHVVQGIEVYKEKFIVYSLANFMFGGNRNPSDKDTFVFQQTFKVKSGTLTDKKEIKVIPFSVSSVTTRNNYQPTPLTGKAADQLKAKLVSLSTKISSSNWVQFEKK